MASLCRSEISWLLRHRSNIPMKKQDLSLLQGQKQQLSMGPLLLDMVHQMQRLRVLAKSEVVRGLEREYLRTLIAGFAVPNLQV